LWFTLKATLLKGLHELNVYACRHRHCII
jgi:hypothetical protein